MATERKTQTGEILKYLKHYKVITDNTAHEKFGANRLSDVIFKLRNRGHIIDTVMVEGTTRYGTFVRYGKYYYRGFKPQKPQKQK